MDFEEYHNFCRFCLEANDSNQNIEFLAINENVENWFYELTQVKFKNFTTYNKICYECFKDLQHSIELKHKLINGQTQLEHSIKIAEVEIKIESKEDENFIFVENEEQIESDNQFDTYDSLQNQSVNLAECPECFDLFDTDIISKHIAKHVKKLPHACNKCKFKTDKLNRLVIHCLKIHNSEPPPKKPKSQLKAKKQCSMCGSLVKNLVEHLKITHGQLKRYHCDHCDYKCYFRAKIERHLQRHIPKQFQTFFKCEQCDFQTNRKDTLKNHYQTMHQANRERKEICETCQKSFYNKSQLNTHTKSVHQKIKNHLCNHCGKSFYTIKDLQIHETRHFEKNVKCSECDSLFFSKNDLQRHKKTRHTLPSIVCNFPDCEKKFHSNSKLKLHIKTKHEQIKEYVCKYSYCDSKFGQYNNLKRHIDTVHKAIRMKCAVENCKYSASRKDKYKSHLISQHKNINKEEREMMLKNIKYE
ncbi:hypothetical protein PVAND_008246 [Polypedilum vanderplanki]|uniref:C2H2-type domain-containing protein n=1 Tax=Polypedilum vanderplanki TaxID=319348 RepID=A0A9J6C9L8_POLVA|nr:hypothetical protein PVAND_008246 [Polypedilum vanderplanki]